MVIHLRTRRLVLRQFTTDDVESLLALDADPLVTRYVTNGAATPRQEIIDDILPAFLDYYRRSPHFGFWAAETIADGRFIGWFHLRAASGHDPAEPELGYRLVRSAWHQGLATEGSVALIDKAFAETDIRRVVAETMVVHTASRRVMEKAGLRELRRFQADWPVRIPGDEFGDIEYGVDRQDWPPLRSPAPSPASGSQP